MEELKTNYAFAVCARVFAILEMEELNCNMAERCESTFRNITRY